MNYTEKTNEVELEVREPQVESTEDENVSVEEKVTDNKKDGE